MRCEFKSSCEVPTLDVEDLKAPIYIVGRIQTSKVNYVVPIINHLKFDYVNIECEL